MKAKVYYLSYYDGKLMFPHELPKNYYSPGLFFIDDEINESSYTFDAMDNGNEISLTLTLLTNNDFYVVETPNYGKLFFKKVDFENNNVLYRGKAKIAKNLKLLVPLNSNKLERICHEFNFYLIGYANKG